MRAAVFASGRAATGPFLQITDVPRPKPQPGHALIRVIACGVCRTDLHIVEKDLPAVRREVIPTTRSLSSSGFWAMHMTRHSSRPAPKILH
jgi:D-arabinose 1-dehydrogenase-like Zn-dependent alcohol dehydrogenase